MLRTLPVLLLGLAAIAPSLPAEPKKPTFTPEQLAFYTKDVLPVLRDNCLKCHSAAKVRGGLRLDNRAAILKGGDLGPAVDLAKLANSPLLKAVHYRDGLEMPPSGKMAAEKIAVLEKWAKMNLPMPDTAVVVSPPEHKPGPITEEDRNWWAYRPLKRPAVPAPKDAAWGRTPIDAFVRAGLEAKALTPVGEADRVALIRRATFDLTGLPPTPEQVDAFVADRRPDAYERLVDSLLASPAYGEKWGRHWLDLVRYAETHGYERDSAKPFAWRYRDYVVNAMNADKPYDRFLVEQLAGDELPGANAETVTATGFYRLNIWDDEPADRALARYDVLDGIVSTTTQVVLGMTVGCARCHDHKKDPIPQKDYYSFLAFFQDVTDMNGRNTRRLASDEGRAAYAAKLRQHQDAENKVHADIYRMEQSALAKLAGRDRERYVGGDISELKYRFYRDTWDSLPAFDTIKHEESGDVGSNLVNLSPASRGEAMGLVFEGRLRIPANGEYTFDAVAAEGVRVIVGGKRVIDKPARGRHAATAKATLTEGVTAIRVEYFNTTARPELSLTWSGPGFEKRSLSQAGSRRGDVARLLAAQGGELLGDRLGEYQALVAKRDKLKAAKPAEPGVEIMCVTESGRRATNVLIRGNPHAKGEEVKPGFPSVLVREQPKLTPTPANGSSGKRLELAKWLTNGSNPMTARVMANRLWQYHFGRGLCATSSDFGKLGETPTHPELLDWLACELGDSGWSLKRLHRTMMLSSVYRLSSKAAPEMLAKDPANNGFWRFNMRRLAAEEVRDSMLAVTGTISRTAGGPSVTPPIPRAVLAGQSVPGAGWGKATAEEAARRSVYVHVKRSLALPILETHDAADTDSSCAVRFTTTVPTQSLGMINGEFTHEQADALAARSSGEAKDDAGRVARIIRLTTGRVPTAAEVAADVEYVKKAGGDAKAWKMYALLALNANEFLYLD